MQNPASRRTILLSMTSEKTPPRILVIAAAIENARAKNAAAVAKPNCTL